MLKRENVFSNFLFVSLPIFIYLVIDVIVEYLGYSILAYMKNESVESLIKHSTDYTALIVISIAVKIVGIIFFYFWYKKDFKIDIIADKWSETVKQNTVFYVIVLLLAIPLCIGSNLLISLIGVANIDSAYKYTSDATYLANPYLSIIAAVFISPIFEELFFRGVIYKRIKAVSNIKYAVIISALIFAVIHGNITQGIYAFIIGVYFAYIYEKIRDLIIPIATHFVMNAVSMIATYSGIIYKLQENIVYMGIYIVICAILVILGIKSINKLLRNC